MQSSGIDLSSVVSGLRNHGVSVDKEDRNFLVTSHSIDGTFESCPRRFEFRHVIGQVPDTEDSGFAAEAGTALHEGLQEWARTGNQDDGYMTLMRWWPFEMEDRRLRKDARTFDNALLLLKELMNHEFWNEWEPAYLPNGEAAIELPYRINHTSLGAFTHPRTNKLTYLAGQGKIDFFLRNRRDGRLLTTDLKTTTYDENVHAAAFRFSGQAGEYGMVLSTAVGHDFRKHGLEVCYLLAEFGPYGPNVRPMTYLLSPAEIDDLIRAKQIRLATMLAYARANHWPRRTHGCVFYGTPCGYLDVCHRRDYKFLLDWFAAEGDRFRFKERIYEPYWTLEA